MDQADYHWTPLLYVTSKFVLIFTSHFASRSVVPSSSYYRRIKQETKRTVTATLGIIEDDLSPRVHWVDNYAKYFPSSAMFPDSALYNSLLWTAHAMKVFPAGVSMSWKLQDGVPIPALPNLDVLFAPELCDSVIQVLGDIKQFAFHDSAMVVNQVFDASFQWISMRTTSFPLKAW